MADPFEALRPDPAPVAPDPTFAARLRQRMERALYPVSRPDPVEASTGPDGDAVPASPELIPYLIVADARRAIEWYGEVFGARSRHDPYVMDDGRIGHSELQVGAAVWFLADEPSDQTYTPAAAPRPGALATVTMLLAVADVDATTARAADAGASVERPPAEQPYGRGAVIRDPFGHRWMLQAPVRPPEPAPVGAERVRQGDVGHVSLWVRDLDTSADFFAAVLGWRYRPVTDHGRMRDRGVPTQGMVGGFDHSTAYLAFAVEDVAAALDRVRVAGGRGGPIQDRPYGAIAECVDDQGCAFAVYQPVPGDDLRPPVNGRSVGDVAYLTMEVVDSARTRAFYGAVLGWVYDPGRVDDGWGPVGTAPMLGLHGGHDRATIVPSYLVADLAGAVAEIRRRGGTAAEPEDRPYGATAECVDPGGTRFYLHQM